MGSPKYKQMLSDTGRVLSDTRRDLKEALWEWITGKSWQGFFVVIALALFIGTVGYWFLGLTGAAGDTDVGVIDALYMAVITMTTVGYGDVYVEGTMAKLFTIFYVVLGVVVYSLSFSRVASAMVEGRIQAVLGRRRMETKIQQLEGHIIVCGFGRFGQITAAEFTRKGIPVVALDTDQEVINSAEEHGVLGIAADATEEESLVRAGIAHARALCCALPTDAENVYTILTARDIREDILITALARDRRAERKLRVAGATDVISPYTIGASHMARQITSPHVAKVVNLAAARSGPRKQTGMYMEEVLLRAGSRLDGMSLKDSPIRREYDVMVVAIINADGEVSFNPGPDHVLRAGDVLVSVGGDAGLSKLERATGHTPTDEGQDGKPG